MTIFGTRPEAIKLAPLINAISRSSEDFKSVLVVTAQHREMLDEVLGLFDICPDYDLNIMKPNQSPFEVTEGILGALRPILESGRPEIVLVQGDTTSAFASALAAFYLKIPIAHVEAGLRTYNKYQPFPEEMNRHMVSVLADWHFAPTERARQNLLREGVLPNRVFVTGNTVIDALLYILNHFDPHLPNFLREPLSTGNRIILVTTHRRENWGMPLRRICKALRHIIQIHSDVIILFFVHPNPNVRSVVHEELCNVPRLFLLEPLDYATFVHLMNVSSLILTDSGGIQEEAPSLGKPVLVLREVTERPEGVEAGILKIVGTDDERIVMETGLLLDDVAAYQDMAKRQNPYGDGQAAERIVRLLKQIL
jgi:UDP-N-acetylglucosamine 2-epimerase (non-hydrolysing)